MDSFFMKIFAFVGTLASIFAFFGIDSGDFNSSLIWLLPVFLVALVSFIKLILSMSKLFSSTRPDFNPKSKEHNALFWSAIFFVLSLTVLIFIFFNRQHEPVKNEGVTAQLEYNECTYNG
jgi:hypothetical protein